MSYAETDIVSAGSNGEHDAGRNGRRNGRPKSGAVKRTNLQVGVRAEDLAALRARLSELYGLGDGRAAPKASFDDAVEWIFTRGLEAFLAKVADRKPADPLEGLR